MTKKRFQIIHLGNPYDFVVKDHQTNKTYGPLQGDDKSLMELLNAFNDENEQLKEIFKTMIKQLEIEIDSEETIYQGTFVFSGESFMVLKKLCK